MTRHRRELAATGLAVGLSLATGCSSSPPYDQRSTAVPTESTVTTASPETTIVQPNATTTTTPEGQVVETDDGWAPRRERYGLSRGSNGRWRIRDAYIVEPA